jgi:hypothetical protein
VQVKDIIEQEVNQPGDMWRELRNQAGDISKAVGLLKNLVPGFEDSLDSIVAAHKAKVDQAALAVKKAQIKVPNKILTSVLSGDPFGEKKDPTPVKNLLKSINAMGWKPKFKETPEGSLIYLPQASEDAANNLSSEYDVEVDPNDLLPFLFFRDVDDRDALMYIEGAILPNGQIVIETLASDNVTDGGEDLYNNAQELIDNINQYWLGL